MAGILAELTGTNPFTIDQNKYSDKGESRYNQPLSKLITTTTPTVLINDKGIIFRSNPSSYETDISIIQPANSFLETTLLLQKSKAYKKIILPKNLIITYPAMILLYRKGEAEQNGVPVSYTHLTLPTNREV